HLLGTDKQGRDILSRIIHGSRISIAVASVGIFIGGSIGTALGLIAGYFRGWVDAVIMRLVDLSLAVPGILLALAIAAVLGPSFGSVIAVIAFMIWAVYARQIRGETLRWREQDFVARAKVAGASHA